jgi:hypothetical protein
MSYRLHSKSTIEIPKSFINYSRQQNSGSLVYIAPTQKLLRHLPGMIRNRGCLFRLSLSTDATENGQQECFIDQSTFDMGSWDLQVVIEEISKFNLHE